MTLYLFPSEAAAVSIYDAQQSPSGDPTAAPAPKTKLPASSKGTAYIIDGQTCYYTGEKIKVVYESRKINLDKTPAIKINGTVMVPLKETFAKQGIQVKYKYTKKLKKITISKNDKYIIMHLNENTITVNQKTTSLPAAPVSVTYKKSGRKTILVPFQEVIKALGINYLWDEDMAVAQLSKPVLNFIGKKLFTPYRWGLSQYALIQKNRTGRASAAEYKRLVDPKKDTSYGFQYLHLDQYRDVNKEAFLSTYNYYIQNTVYSGNREWS